MTLWYFQLLLNFFFVVGVLYVLRQRREQQILRQRLTGLERQLQSQRAAAPVGVEVPLSLPPPSSGSVLNEKTVQASAKPERLSRASVLEAYDKAELLLAQGVDLKEVARRTGLSVSELQLFGKVSQKNQ